MTTFKKIIALILALVCITSLVACDLGFGKDGDNEATESQTEKKEEKPSGEITFDFISNGDGTCTARMLYADTDEEMELSVEFPATSPDGDKVTSISVCPTTRYGNVPLMIPKDDFDKVREAMNDYADKQNSADAKFQVKKCEAYYILQDPSTATENVKNLMFKTYPITKEMPVYTLDESIASWELERLSTTLYTFGDFDMEDRAKAHKETKVEAFSGMHGNVVSATIPEGVTVLDATFGGWDTLKSVSLPASLEKINLGTFINCTNITEIKFAGTVEQWNAIEKVQISNDEPWDSDIVSYTVICSDGTVSK